MLLSNGVDATEIFLPQFGAHHGNMGGKTLERGEQIALRTPGLPFRSVQFDLPDDGTKLPQFFTRQVGLFIDHNARHFAARSPAHDVRFVRMQHKALVLYDLPNLPE